MLAHARAVVAGQDGAIRCQQRGVEDAAAGRQTVQAVLERGLSVGVQAARLEVILTQIEPHEAAHRIRVRADGRVQDGGRRIGGHERGLAGCGRAHDHEEGGEDEQEENRSDGAGAIGWTFDGSPRACG